MTEDVSLQTPPRHLQCGFFMSHCVLNQKTPEYTQSYRLQYRHYNIETWSISFFHVYLNCVNTRDIKFSLGVQMSSMHLTE